MTLRRHQLLTPLLFAALFGVALFFYLHDRTQQPERPNFLLVITDDQSWIHTSFAGYPAVSTPNFDRLAQEGIYFDRAYASAPTCTASRSAILTGQHFWRLGSAGQLRGEFPRSLETYQKILESHGYKTGFTGKGWGPGLALFGNPAGRAFNKIRRDGDPNFSHYDHLANFQVFLEQRKPGQPFSFWYSPTEPHRPFLTGIGARSGEVPMARITVPPFLPDRQEIREDMADYLYEIQWFDRELGQLLQLLEEEKLLDNTVIVYTSDNGMPFPRAKNNNYDYGTRVPLAIRWGDGVRKHQTVTDLVSLTDLAPTFLELAGLSVPPEMTGKSLRQQLLAGRSGRIDPQRNAVLSGFERHIATARQKNRGYPSRAIHTDEYVYIRNFAAERWPAGRPPLLSDIDDSSPTKKLMVSQRKDFESFWQLAAGMRPAEELYNVARDTAQLDNLADNPEYAAIKATLAAELETALQQSGDPRVTGSGEDFELYPYHGRESD